MIRVLILSQDENVYLPASFAEVCRKLGSRIVTIVTLPAMSTHGGSIKGFLRHAKLFGFCGTMRMAVRVLKARFFAAISRPGVDGPYYSLKAVSEGFLVPYYNCANMKSPEFQAILDRFKPELLVSMSCPQIIRQEVRRQFPKGCINVHGAPLPRYRGLMPAFWALLNGEKTTAATVHDLAAKLDDGAILLQKEVPVDPEDTWDSLIRKTKAAGAQALVEAVLQIESDCVQRKPNREEDATYFSFPNAEDRKAFFATGRRFF
jgi:methionyl-tRNA formyltransferase